MNTSFAETVRRLRIRNGLSQQNLANLMHVDRSTVAKWEAGSRMPDAAMISRLSVCLHTDVAEIFSSCEKEFNNPRIILVDDEQIILSGSMPLLEQEFPDTVITGFTSPAAAIAYAKANRVDLAYLDIEIGRINGLDVCRELLEINPFSNVFFVTAYRDYAFDAWSTGACGFLLKPLTAESVRDSVALMRHPFGGGSST